jgi:cell division protein FtsL
MNILFVKTIIIMFLVGSVLSSAFSVIHAKHMTRKNFVELQILQKQRDDMDDYWGRLQLEQGAWATHGRIEDLARNKLEMVMPNSKSIVIIQP